MHSVETASWACNFLMRFKECNSVIVTLGEKGAVFQNNKSAIPVHIPATVVKAVDTTVSWTFWTDFLKANPLIKPEK